LNPYYVSHLIKKTLGIPFQHFLNGIRLEFAEKNLLFTTLSLTQVSEYSGFSSLNYFNKCFHEWYGFTPSHYRKNIPLGKRRTGPSFQKSEALDLTGRHLSPVVAIKKIVLAPSFPAFDGNIHSNTETGETWGAAMDTGLVSSTNPSLRPRILLTGQDDFLGLGFLKERVSAIKPSAFLISSRMNSPVAYSALQTFGVPLESYEPPCNDPSGIPSGNQAREQAQSQPSMIRNTALALAQIISDDIHSNPNGQVRSIAPPIPLLGNQNALFLPNGLATPLYTAYQLLAALPGTVLDRTPQSLQTRSGNQLTILLFNPDPRTILNVRLETKNLPEQFVLMKKQIPEENNCYEIIEALGHPDALPSEVVREIDQSHLGVPHFQMVDNAISPVIDLMVYPQHVTLLVISPLTNRSLL
jgi:Helix-turn-helix domain